MYHKIIISFSFCSEGFADIVYIGIMIYHSFRQSLSLNQFILNVKSINSAKNWDCTIHKAWCDFEWHINMWIMNKSQAGSQYIVAVVHAFVLIAQKSGFHTLFSLWSHYQTIQLQFTMQIRNF